jgi:predicted RNA-binding protein Jag
MSSFADGGSYRGGPPSRRYGRTAGRPPAAGSGRASRAPYATRGSAERQRPACPPELRPVLKEALDFLAGLIRVMGLPARLSFGGIEPARDGVQLTLDVRALHRSAPRQRYADPGGERDDELALLIGKHGATLDAISAVTNAALHDDGRDVFFSVDVEGYRARRTATLRSIAQRCGERALREGVAIELEPMPPADRRIVHLALANNRSLATESTGIGAGRRVVILPRQSSLARDDYAD